MPNRAIAWVLALVATLGAGLRPDPAAAQDAAEDASVFRPLDLPAPTPYRNGSGAPGPAYWQQRADYRIAAVLDTAGKRLSGEAVIRYTNHSPDTLRYVWLQLDQNVYRSTSAGSALFPDDTRFGGAGFDGGMELAYTKVGGAAVEPTVRGTRMRLDLPQPLPPGGAVELEIGWSFRVPEHGSDRMARDGTLYEMAQWYPRMAVYDDVSGWNTDPYLGQGEFYLEYGSFDVAITVPAGYIVAATGTLRNPDEVLTPAQRRRLERAATAEEQVAIIGADEAGTAAARPTTEGQLTWRFHADNVRDFAWAASPDFRWDAMSTDDGVLCQALYEPEATAWQTAADMTCFSIEEFSKRWYPYPYPQATSIAGPVGGMEYPMIVFVHASGQEGQVFRTIAHEHGHQWFPMIVGSNERRHAWMDEGFNTFIETWANDLRYPGSDSRALYRGAYDYGRATGKDRPIVTPPDRLPPSALGLVAYHKPAMVLHLLRDQVLGPEVFDDAFREYIRRWAFKHPQPAEFFRTMEDVSGQDLDWFFRGWLYTDETLDQAVDTVQQMRSGGEVLVAVHLSTDPPVVMPVDLTFTLANGETREVSLPVEIWYRGTEYVYETRLPARVTAVTIDAAEAVPDVDRTNNSWRAAAGEP